MSEKRKNVDKKSDSWQKLEFSDKFNNLNRSEFIKFWENIVNILNDDEFKSLKSNFSLKFTNKSINWYNNNIDNVIESEKVDVITKLIQK